MLVIGTRPEAIKMAPVIQELRKYPEKIKTIVLITGQHDELLNQALELFKISPDYNLKVMEDNQSLTNITMKVLSGMEEILMEVNPALILTQGDTTTTFAASLAGFYKKVLIGHIEAGLRTNNKYYPFPEEINRTLVSTLADFHYAPTKSAAKNLLRQGIEKEKVYVTGNTVIDALLYMIDNDYTFDFDFDMNFDKKRVILVTAHRRENFGKPLENICLAIKEILDREEDVQVIYPIHLNPNVRKTVKDILQSVERIHLIEPLDYKSFVNLMSRCYLILTDSGGIQEEAPSLGKPVLVLRNETERPEAVGAGTVRIVGTDRERIVTNVLILLNNQAAYQKMSHAINPYGDGKASQRIVAHILRYFNIQK
ncbi:MAG: non-hydrolyzing UDP-N-acetylglucosamine 2-epimerase [Candidatus Hodarchaeota archaeon]